MVAISRSSFRLRELDQVFAVRAVHSAAAALQLFDDAEVEVYRDVAEEGDGAVYLAQHLVMKPRVGEGERFGAFVGHEHDREAALLRFAALHAVREEHRLGAELFDRVPARDLRAARQPAKRRVHRLVHRHDHRADPARRHQ
ncbi:MAG TPA: hypothetical protein VGJ82_16880 [Thermoanaerobaculia bacterium]